MHKELNRTKVFLENYNKGDKTLEKLLKSSASIILADIDSILKTSGKSDLKVSFGRMKIILNEDTRSPLEKIMSMGIILSAVSSDIIKSTDKTVKKKGLNLLFHFLELTKNSRNGVLLISVNQIINVLETYVQNPS